MKKNNKILLLEDESVDLMLITKVLKKYKFDVIEVSNSKEAIIEFEKDPSFDLLLFDVRLNIGDDKKDPYAGVSIAKKIIDQCPTPVILISKSNDSTLYEYASKRLNFYFKGFLSKDLLHKKKEDEFIQEIQKVIDNFYAERFSSSKLSQLYTNRRIGIRKKVNEPYFFYHKDDILFIRVDNGVVKVYLTDGNTVPISSTLSGIASQLSPYYNNFLKVDGTNCINLEKIWQLHKLPDTNKRLILFKDNENKIIEVEISYDGFKELKKNILLVEAR